VLTGINDLHHSLQNRHDDGFMNIESVFQFFFKRSKFLCQLALVTEQCSHFQERTHSDSDCVSLRDSAPLSQRGRSTRDRNPALRVLRGFRR
jgi:hypothetical protein